MHIFLRSAIISLAVIFAVPALAQTKGALSGSQLEALTKDGFNVMLGGAGKGYFGNLKLSKNGWGEGSAKTDAGQTIKIEGTWVIRDGKFCRTWKELDRGKEVCETWVAISPRSVDVYNGKKRIGVNSW